MLHKHQGAFELLALSCVAPRLQIGDYGIAKRERDAIQTTEN